MTVKERNNMILFGAAFGIVAAMTVGHRHSQKQVEVNFANVSVIGQGKLVLLELGSDQCVPCKMMAPVLKELSEQYPQHFTVAFHDVWKDSTVGEKYGISVIPTQIFFDKDGKELFRHEGFFAKDDILTKWKELGVAVIQ
jgi:thiol-disulfide isomerase/thioredoxin